MNQFSNKDLVFQAMVASIYVVLVYLFQFMSFKEIQFRVAEVLLILIFFDKKSILGLTIGTFVANWLLSPFGLIDAFVGSTATFIGLLLMISLKKKYIIALLMPALANGLIIGLMITYFDQIPLFITFSWVFFGEFVILYALGLPMYLILRKHNDFLEFFNKRP